MNWAFVGASTIAEQYLTDAVRAQPSAQIGWIVSGTPARAAAFARAHAVEKWTTDLSEALGDVTVDAVYISSTNEKHHAQALAAIRAGTHVLCEKPLAMAVGQAVARSGSPAAMGTGGLKSLIIARAVRDAALTGICQTITYGDAK